MQRPGEMSLSGLFYKIKPYQKGITIIGMYTEDERYGTSIIEPVTDIGRDPFNLQNNPVR